MAASILPLISFLVFSSSTFTHGLSNNQIPNSPITYNFTAVLAFGDSTLDTGNNNFIKSLFRSDHIPYGRDFPNQVPTGRFSDGKLIPDLVATFLGIKETIPPFLDPSLTPKDLVSGVCFASAGAGYDDATNVEVGVIPVMKQLDYFRTYIAELGGAVGAAEAEKIVNGALYMVSAGTNDLAATRNSRFSDVGGYQDFILRRLIKFVKRLYKLGARKIAVAGLPPMGCLPIQITAHTMIPIDRSCIEEQNSDAMAYNQKLQNVLNSLKLPGSTLLYINVYGPLFDMVTRPQIYGMEVTDVGCCGTGLVEAGGLCNALSTTCEDPSKYLFWDSIHPTLAAYNSLIAYLQNTLIPNFFINSTTTTTTTPGG